MNKLDDFLKLCGIRLYPFQRTVLKKVVSDKKIHVVFPKQHGHDEVNELLFELHRQALILEEAERRMNEGGSDV